MCAGAVAVQVGYPAKRPRTRREPAAKTERAGKRAAKRAGTAPPPAAESQQDAAAPDAVREALAILEEMNACAMKVKSLVQGLAVTQVRRALRVCGAG
jgi:hypothetical protein